MARYFNKTDKNEYLHLSGGDLPSQVEELPSGNVFWDPVPSGQYIIYVDDLPSHLDDIPPSGVSGGVWGEAKGIRSFRVDKNYLNVSGHSYQVDGTSREAINAAVIVMNPSGDVNWRMSDNIQYSVTREELQTVQQYYVDRRSIVYDASWLVEQDIKDSIDPASLDLEYLYDYHISGIVLGQLDYSVWNT